MNEVDVVNIRLSMLGLFVYVIVWGREIKIKFDSFIKYIVF